MLMEVMFHIHLDDNDTKIHSLDTYRDREGCCGTYIPFAYKNSIHPSLGA